MADKTQLGRVAFRVEGEMWNAYFADPDTMEDAELLGSIKMSLVQHPDSKEAFMALIRQAMNLVFKETLGTEAEWPGATPAPEHERSGTA